MACSDYIPGGRNHHFCGQIIMGQNRIPVEEKWRQGFEFNPRGIANLEKC